jgi:hypothetical protein
MSSTELPEAFTPSGILLTNPMEAEQERACNVANQSRAAPEPSQVPRRAAVQQQALNPRNLL